MAKHELKTDPKVFQDLWDNKKNFELRYDDRGYKVGDLLILHETKFSNKEMKKGFPLEYTGRTFYADVSYIMRGPQYGLMDGWVIMSFPEG